MPRRIRRLIPWLLCFLAIMGFAEPRLLPFRWDVEQMTDPKHMLVIAINGDATAPTIRAQRGDTIVVEVRNSLGRELVIQWQILEKVLNRQCGGTDRPISAGQTASYCLAAKQAGQYSYQVESKLQRDAGLKGSVVVL
ncbi:hypothetical protein BT93_I0242 [Corymbia citriodora subsp. variegata]|nr:hypothetical protein BT93_I0242 [Corymbia citriodora subsp. variegata]